MASGRPGMSRPSTVWTGNRDELLPVKTGALCGSEAPPVSSELSAEAASRSGLLRPAVATEGGGVRPCDRAPSRGALVRSPSDGPAPELASAAALASASVLASAAALASVAAALASASVRSISPALTPRLARARLPAAPDAPSSGRPLVGHTDESLLSLYTKEAAACVGGVETGRG